MLRSMNCSPTRLSHYEVNGRRLAMNRSLLENLLRCPFCGGPLNGMENNVTSNAMESGVLTCDCSRFPVVAGIPILKRDRISEQAMSLLEEGRYWEALLILIQPGGMLLPSIWRLSSCLPLGNQLRSFAHQKRVQHWRDRIADLLHRMDSGERVTVSELLEAYYSDKEHYHYFALRFGQPRYLVALSFTQLLRCPNKPILDVCCGQGHVTRSLVQQANGQRVIGVDRSFWNLYVAKRWIAPEADYVCCSADHGLPFAEKVFSAVFSSDAFHYIVDKRSCVQEFQRIMEDGVIVLTWVHNKCVRVAHDGVPLSPGGYHALFQGIPHRIVADDEVLSRYFGKQGPNLSVQPDTALLNQTPLLSIVASTRQDIFREYGAFEEPPHAKGRLGINPLYTREMDQGENGNIRLHRRFPSRFYEVEHPEYKKYMPETVELSSTTLSDLAGERRTAAIEQLIDRCIVLGLPNHFYRELQPGMPMDEAISSRV